MQERDVEELKKTYENLEKQIAFYEEMIRKYGGAMEKRYSAVDMLNILHGIKCVKRKPKPRERVRERVM